jgi:hypothetical protein
MVRLNIAASSRVIAKISIRELLTRNSDKSRMHWGDLVTISVEASFLAVVTLIAMWLRD